MPKYQLPPRLRRNKVSRKLPDPDGQYASDSSDLTPTPPPRPPRSKPIHERNLDGTWQIDLALDRATLQVSLVRCGLRTFLGIESNAVFGVLFVQKQPARHNTGLREKEQFTLYFTVATHDPCNPITLISFGPQVVLARHEKYPHVAGPIWTTHDWRIEHPFEFVTTHEWIKKWIAGIMRHTPELAMRFRISDVLDWLRPIERSALAGFTEAMRTPSPAADPESDAPTIKAESITS